MHITRTLALRLLKRQEWGTPRTVTPPRRPSALSARRRRLTSRSRTDTEEADHGTH
jgi:hypothetical protein